MKIKFAVTIVLVVSGLVSCTQYRMHSTYAEYPAYEGYRYGDYQEYSDPDVSRYSVYQRNDYNPQRDNRVNVPESYHVGSYHSPQSHRNRDSGWVKGQNPQAYTIQLAEGRKASDVARALTRAPKRDRMATVKSFNGDSAYFRGLYGSYRSYDEAQQALNTLPADLKGQASIKQWGSVQN